MTDRLDTQKHQEEIRPGIDPLRNSRIEPERERETSFVLRGKLAPFLLVRGVARSKDGELPALFEQPRSDRGKKVHALLLDEPANDAEYGLRRIDVEARFLLERCLVDRLAALVFRVVPRGDIGIVRRVEELRVDSVGDAPKIRAALAKEALETLSKFGGEDLFSVALADCRDDVGRRDRARHQVGFAAILDRKTGARKADELQNLGVRSSLIGEIVDGEHGRRLPELTRPRRERDQKRSVPVMRVDYVGWCFEEVLQHSAAEKCVALRVIVVAVDLVAPDAHAAHEHRSDAVARNFRVLDPGARRTVRDGVSPRARCRYSELLCVYRAVIRHVDGDVVPE